jgi:hypothetical protein
MTKSSELSTPQKRGLEIGLLVVIALFGFWLSPILINVESTLVMLTGFLLVMVSVGLLLRAAYIGFTLFKKGK